MCIKVNYINCNFFVAPFIDAKKHFIIATCKKSKINDLFNDKIISKSHNKLPNLNLKERVKHFVLGMLETIGVILLVVPFITSIAERHFNKSNDKSPSSTISPSSTKSPTSTISPSSTTYPTSTISPTSTTSPSSTTSLKKSIPKYEILNKILSVLHHRKPHNSFEYAIDWVKKLNDTNYFKIAQFLDDGLLLPYECRHDVESGGNVMMSNTLLSSYIGTREDCACLGLDGNYYASHQNNPVIAYLSDLISLVSTDIITSHITNVLKNELEKNPTHRPKKIFIPMGTEMNHIGHSMMIVIEPSSQNMKEARISMINTLGHPSNMYYEYEKAAMDAAKSVYNSNKTTVVRNEKLICTTSYSCTHDIVEIARELIDVPNVQFVIKEGLKRKTPQDDRQARLKHGEDALRFLQKY